MAVTLWKLVAQENGEHYPLSLGSHLTVQDAFAAAWERGPGHYRIRALEGEQRGKALVRFSVSVAGGQVGDRERRSAERAQAADAGFSGSVDVDDYRDVIPLRCGSGA